MNIVYIHTIICAHVYMYIYTYMYTYNLGGENSTTYLPFCVQSENDNIYSFLNTFLRIQVIFLGEMEINWFNAC